ncbi:MAG: 3-oxoacyl-ACP reductase FabG [Candidatus Neomarinimicrobiota bacterium]
MKRLQDKIAVITGAARGIGKATAEKFAAEGATVIIADYDEKNGLATASELAEKGGRVDFVKTDVSSADSVGNLFGMVEQNYGRVDILVNNAGILQDSTLKKLEEQQFDRVIDVNLKGVYLCTQAAVALMDAEKGGVVLNASSVVAHTGNFGQTNYVASKAGVIGMTKVWARELGRKHIRVNAVAPGFIRTEMTEGIPDKVMEMMLQRVPLGRMGEGSEIADAYCFLASDEASYITGATLNVDGGTVT